MAIAMDNDEMGVEIISPNTGALEQMERASIDVQIATAQRYPKHSTPAQIKAFQQRATAMATIDADTAASCLYALPRDGKSIEGLSVRLAEIAIATYGNIRAGARIIDIGETTVTVQGVCHDLENNVYQSAEVRRRITNKYGKRYNEDMITVTANAACSIAMRNAVFKVIPRALLKGVEYEARHCAVGDNKTIGQRRAKALERFSLMGVTEAQVLRFLKLGNVAEINGEKLADLIGVFNAIKAGETSIEDQFGEPEVQAKPERGADALAAKLGGDKPSGPITANGNPVGEQPADFLPE